MVLRPERAIDHAGLGSVYQKLGRTEEAIHELMEARRFAENENRYNRACIAALCGELKEAWTLLEQALGDHETTAAWVRQDPDWEDLREHPEFKAILDRY